MSKTAEKGRKQEPVGVAIVEYWPWDGNIYALYTENPEVAKMVRKNGLRLVGEYFRNSPFSQPFAWQFAGPKEKVLTLARKALRGEPEVTAKVKPIGTDRAPGRKPEPAPAKARENAPGRREEKDRRPVTLSVCPRCGGQFEPKSNRQTYCNTCARAAERERKAEWKRTKAVAGGRGRGQKVDV